MEEGILEEGAEAAGFIHVRCRLVEVALGEGNGQVGERIVAPSFGVAK